MKANKVRNYLFIAYEMYVKGKTKEWLDKDLYGIELLCEMDEFKRWMRREGIELPNEE